MSWYTIVRTVADGGDVAAQLERETNPGISGLFARSSARKWLDQDRFSDEEAGRVRDWLNETEET